VLNVLYADLLADATKPERATWSADQLRGYVERTQAASDRHHALRVLLATTEMRRGEALGPRWSDPTQAE
jgi:hypothetical protein